MTDTRKETPFKPDNNVKELGRKALRDLLAESLSGNRTTTNIFDIPQLGPNGENGYELPSIEKFRGEEGILVGVAFLTETHINDASKFGTVAGRRSFFSMEFPGMNEGLKLRLSRQGVLEDLQRMLRYFGSSAIKQEIREAIGNTEEEVEERLREKGLITNKFTLIVPSESLKDGGREVRDRETHLVYGRDKDRDPAQWDKFAAFKQSGKEAPAVPNSPQFTQNYTVEGLVIGLYAPLLSVGIEMVK